MKYVFCILNLQIYKINIIDYKYKRNYKICKLKNANSSLQSELFGIEIKLKRSIF